MSNSHESSRDFYIQIVDEDSYVAIEEYYLGSYTIEHICQCLNLSIDSLYSSSCLALEDDLLDRAEAAFGLRIPKDTGMVNLVSWSAMDGIPYRTHAGREFLLMRERLKPLAVFTSIIPELADAIKAPDNVFHDLINKKLVCVRRYCELINKGSSLFGIEVTLYAISGEEWRIDAYILLRSIARKVGWSDPLTRMEGSLLGYSEWQNDVFLSNRSSTAPT